MLNICTERRSIREGGLPFAMTSNNSRFNNANEEDEDDEDEFFECGEDADEGKVNLYPVYLDFSAFCLQFRSNKK